MTSFPQEICTHHRINLNRPHSNRSQQQQQQEQKQLHQRRPLSATAMEILQNLEDLEEEAKPKSPYRTATVNTSSRKNPYYDGADDNCEYDVDVEGDDYDEGEPPHITFKSSRNHLSRKSQHHHHYRPTDISTNNAAAVITATTKRNPTIHTSTASNHHNYRRNIVTATGDKQVPVRPPGEVFVDLTSARTASNSLIANNANNTSRTPTANTTRKTTNSTSTQKPCANNNAMTISKSTNNNDNTTTSTRTPRRRESTPLRSNKHDDLRLKVLESLVLNPVTPSTQTRELVRSLSRERKKKSCSSSGNQGAAGKSKKKASVGGVNTSRGRSPNVRFTSSSAAVVSENIHPNIIVRQDVPKRSSFQKNHDPITRQNENTNHNDGHNGEIPLIITPTRKQSQQHQQHSCSSSSIPGQQIDTKPSGDASDSATTMTMITSVSSCDDSASTPILKNLSTTSNNTSNNKDENGDDDKNENESSQNDNTMIDDKAKEGNTTVKSTTSRTRAATPTTFRRSMSRERPPQSPSSRKARRSSLSPIGRMMKRVTSQNNNENSSHDDDNKSATTAASLSSDGNVDVIAAAVAQALSKREQDHQSSLELLKKQLDLQKEMIRNQEEKLRSLINTNTAATDAASVTTTTDSASVSTSADNGSISPQRKEVQSSSSSPPLSDNSSANDKDQSPPKPVCVESDDVTDLNDPEDRTIYLKAEVNCNGLIIVDTSEYSLPTQPPPSSTTTTKPNVNNEKNTIDYNPPHHDCYSNNVDNKSRMMELQSSPASMMNKSAATSPTTSLRDTSFMTSPSTTSSSSVATPSSYQNCDSVASTPIRGSNSCKSPVSGKLPPPSTDDEKKEGYDDAKKENLTPVIFPLDKHAKPYVYPDDNNGDKSKECIVEDRKGTDQIIVSRMMNNASGLVQLAKGKSLLDDAFTELGDTNSLLLPKSDDNEAEIVMKSCTFVPNITVSVQAPKGGLFSILNGTENIGNIKSHGNDCTISSDCESTEQHAEESVSLYSDTDGDNTSVSSGGLSLGSANNNTIGKALFDEDCDEFEGDNQNDVESIGLNPTTTALLKNNYNPIIGKMIKNHLILAKKVDESVQSDLQSHSQDDVLDILYNLEAKMRCYGSDISEGSESCSSESDDDLSHDEDYEEGDDLKETRNNIMGVPFPSDLLSPPRVVRQRQKSTDRSEEDSEDTGSDTFDEDTVTRDNSTEFCSMDEVKNKTKKKVILDISMKDLFAPRDPCSFDEEGLFGIVRGDSVICILDSPGIKSFTNRAKRSNTRRKKRSLFGSPSKAKKSFSFCKFGVTQSIETMRSLNINGTVLSKKVLFEDFCKSAAPVMLERQHSYESYCQVCSDESRNDAIKKISSQLEAAIVDDLQVSSCFLIISYDSFLKYLMHRVSVRVENLNHRCKVSNKCCPSLQMNLEVTNALVKISKKATGRWH